MRESIATSGKSHLGKSHSFVKEGIYLTSALGETLHEEPSKTGRGDKEIMSEGIQGKETSLHKVRSMSVAV